MRLCLFIYFGRSFVMLVFMLNITASVRVVQRAVFRAVCLRSKCFAIEMTFPSVRLSDRL